MEGDKSSKKLTLIKYFANYCKICQRTGIKLEKIAKEYPDVEFMKVESQVFPDKLKTLTSLGVTKFPFVQIYRQGKCVASFSTGPSHMFVRRVRETLDTCEERSGQEWNTFECDFSSEINDNNIARQNIGLTP